RDTLHHILDEDPEPATERSPLLVGVVHELNVGIAALVFAGDQSGLGVGDAAAGRQREDEIAIAIIGGDLADWPRLAGADGDADCACELAPECRGLWVFPAPSLNVVQNLGIGAGVGRYPAPSTAAAAKTAGELAGFADLPLVRGDVLRRLVQHLAGDQAVGLPRLGAGRVKVSVGGQFPRLATKPRQHPGFDRAEIGGQQNVAGSRTDYRAGDVTEDGERIAERTKLVRVASANGLKRHERNPGLVLFEVLQLRPAPAPTSWPRTVDPHGAAQAVVVAERAQDPFVLSHRGARAVAPELKQPAHLVARVPSEHGSDRLLADRGHGVTMGIDEAADALDLIDRVDLAAGELTDGGVEAGALDLCQV